MKLIIESTTKTVELRVNGADVPARIWEGHTESGVPVHVYITRVAVAEGLALTQYAEFERELAEQRKPSFEVGSIPLRLIL
jgi:hypothetical protein